MKILIRNAHVVESGKISSPVDILSVEGQIEKMAPGLSGEGCRVVEFENLHVSEGWFDSSVSLGEPGFEDRETIGNGLRTAGLSGFTGLALQPNTFPVMDNQGLINFVRHKSSGYATELFPVGALTKSSEGKDMAELLDMKLAGAVAFGDYNKNIDNPNLLRIALQYVQDFDALIIAYSMDRHIAGTGVANEGITATGLGLKGIPALAEELQIARNLYLLEYTGGKLHIPCISTAAGVNLIRQAKKKGLDVSCSASVHHLSLTDELLTGFDTRYKVTPPLRTSADCHALIEGLKDWTIDMVTSDHNPIDIEQKKMEFDLAAPGTIGLESAFGILNRILPLELTIEKLTAARKRFGEGESRIREGEHANLTLFNPDGRSTFTKADILSKSKNSAFLGQPVKGRVYGVFNNGILEISNAG